MRSCNASGACRTHSFIRTRIHAHTYFNTHSLSIRLVPRSLHTTAATAHRIAQFGAPQEGRHTTLHTTSSLFAPTRSYVYSSASQQKQNKQNKHATAITSVRASETARGSVLCARYYARACCVVAFSYSLVHPEHGKNRTAGIPDRFATELRLVLVDDCRGGPYS